MEFNLPPEIKNRWDSDQYPILTTYHCGYVSTFHHNCGYDRFWDAETEITEEPTFAGDLEERGGENGRWYIGFDTHHYNDTPLTASYEAVFKRTKAFADSIIAIEYEWECEKNGVKNNEKTN